MKDSKKAKNEARILESQVKEFKWTGIQSTGVVCKWIMLQRTCDGRVRNVVTWVHYREYNYELFLLIMILKKMF